MKAPLSLLLATLVHASAALAQGYPSKPVRLIVPFAPGGGTDIMARIMAQRVSDAFGQQVVVDNRAGGGGTIGAEIAVRASADGYTLIIVSAGYATNAALYKLPYDPVHDIQPIVQIGNAGLVIASHPLVPVRNVSDLIAQARANPGKLNFGTAGTGGFAHLAAELFKLEARVDLTHVPYKGAAPALTDLIGGQIQLLFANMISTTAHAKSGRLRLIGVASSKRMAVLPDVPSIGETVPGYEAVSWYGMWGPKGLPREVVMRWHRETTKVLRLEEMKNRMASEGVEPVDGSPENFLDSIRRDVQKWKRVVREARIAVAG